MLAVRICFRFRSGGRGRCRKFQTVAWTPDLSSRAGILLRKITGARYLRRLPPTATGRYTRLRSPRKGFLPLQFEPRDQFDQRQKKLEQIRALGIDTFPREFRWTDTPAALTGKYAETPAGELETERRE